MFFNFCIQSAKVVLTKFVDTEVEKKTFFQVLIKDRKLLERKILTENFLLFTVDDASGRYTTGYFWGNNYWTGSKALCERIYRTDNDDFHIKKPSANTGLTTINGNVVTAELRHENPPFFPRFGILKVVLNQTEMMPTVRAFYLPLTNC